MNGGRDTTPGTGIFLTLQPIDYVSPRRFLLVSPRNCWLAKLNGRYTSRGTYRHPRVSVPVWIASLANGIQTGKRDIPDLPGSS